MAFSDAELAAVDHYFVERSFKRRDFLLEASHVCRHLFFVAKGCVRHFHIKEDGSEATCDITLENQWATDFVSFADETPSRLWLQALEDTVAVRPELLQRVPQKHIASLLGISPESLSRLQKRMCDRRRNLT